MWRTTSSWANGVSRRAQGMLLAGLLASQALLLAWEGHRNSITWDEVVYLAAGISHWELGKFDLARVNPPLVRMVATLPVVLFTDPVTDWSSYPKKEYIRGCHVVGKDFVAANGAASFWYYTLARLACIPFVLIGGVVCHAWARRLYGSGAGLMAAALWCFSPTILAHGQLITADVGATSLGALAGYCFWRWLRSSTCGSADSGASWTWAFIAGISLGLAELTKSSWIVLFGVWPYLWIFWRATAPSANARSAQPWWKGLLQVGLIVSLGVSSINLGYGFEGSFRRLGDYRFASHTLAGPSDARYPDHNRFSGSWLAHVPVPLPRNYVQGIDTQKADFDGHMWSYLRGEWRHGGWWYYYLYAWAIKEPLGTWLLLLLTLVVAASWLRRRRNQPSAAVGNKQSSSAANSAVRCATWRDNVVLLTPAVVILTLVSSQTGFNHHMRYTLPAFPFMFIWISQLAGLLSVGGRTGPAENRSRAGWRVGALRGLVAVSMTWSVASSLWLYPHTTSYFNELVGGPWGGPRHLTDSNVDWGQDLLHFKRWLDRHPQARPLGLSYVVPLIDPKIAGIDWESIPPGGDAEEEDRWDLPPEEQGPLPGWYAISVNHIHDRRQQYWYFRHFHPLATAGYSTYIYHLTPEEVNLVRQQYGLPPVAAES